MVTLDSKPCGRVFEQGEKVWMFQNYILTWKPMQCGIGTITASCDGQTWLCRDCYRELGYEW